MYHYEQLTAPVSPAQLDHALSRGYYRMAQMIHTDTAILLDNERFAAVYWLRIRLNGPEQSRTQAKALRWLSERFTIHLVGGQLLNDEVEALYDAYKRVIDFAHHTTTARTYLMGEATTNHYPTRTLLVRERDDGRLAAAGFYDEGATANAGILNFYHPDYHRQSLGRALYFLALHMALRTGKAFFYPGYIAQGFTRFDYKTQHISNPMELYDMEAEVWRPFDGDLAGHLAGLAAATAAGSNGPGFGDAE